MNWWIDAAQYATDALALVLIVRLLSLRDRREAVYLVFVFFLLTKIFDSAAFFIFNRWGQGVVDYRILWICSIGFSSLLSLGVVYLLAKAVLAELPGVFRFSRYFLNGVFVLALVIAFSTARGEYWVAHGAKYQDPVDRMAFGAFVLDRAISMSAVIVLAAILAFILWFPVRMPRNLAIFSLGFVVYFASKTGLELLHTYSAPGLASTNIMSICGNFVLVLCFLYWILFIDPQGQSAQVRLGHGWRVAEQNKLIGQLEALNLVLVRNSQKLEL